MRRAVFLDRDGVINAMVYNAEFGTVDSPSNPDEFRLLSGVGEAIRRLKDLGYLAVVISNQPGVAKGKFTLPLLEATKAKMVSQLADQDVQLDAIYYCLHHPHAVLDDYRQICECRKPRPGMLLQAEADWDIDLARSYFVGDGITDVVAGRKAGCTTILVNSRKCYICDELERQEVAPDYMAKDLSDAARAIAEIDAGNVEAEMRYRFNCQLVCD